VTRSLVGHEVLGYLDGLHHRRRHPHHRTRPRCFHSSGLMRELQFVFGCPIGCVAPVLFDVELAGFVVDVALTAGIDVVVAFAVDGAAVGADV